ncbi:hypothetical protein AVEN_194213-1 [Araneus ventricosus]|uniref:Uncharacterized protein n=1 Tax=Araneus ventricosus TaxID=182803 RepID=A0A4Y2HGI2_ARAVE|nr:hypothetical protein AVEN_194213-1 [Araneus ventricosus]
MPELSFSDLVRGELRSCCDLVRGRRNCPGEKIAWKEILYYFSEIIKKFEISTPPGIDPEFEVNSGMNKHLVPQPLCFKERNI